MTKLNIEIGKNYGSWKVLSSTENNRYVAQCFCGKTRIATASQLVRHKTTKCCCRKGNNHGLSKMPLFNTWYSMLERCYNPKASGYNNYGAKGIEVCAEWKDRDSGFVNFYNWSVQNGYKEERLPSGRNKLSLDRIDGTQGYSPNNCRWVDQIIQCCNRVYLPTNTSGYRGVSWSKTERKWICYVSIKHKTIRIGGFKTQKEAVEKRNEYIEKNNLPHKKNTYIGEIRNENY